MVNYNPVALAGLAVLKVRWDTGQGDHVGNFLPFVVDCVRSSNLSDIKSADVCQLLEKEYGLVIPALSIDTVINRAIREGYFRRNQNRVEPVAGRIAEIDLR